jgi:hypothetical protein
LGSTHSALTPLLQSTHLGDLHSTVSKSEEFKGTTAIRKCSSIDHCALN